MKKIILVLAIAMISSNGFAQESAALTGMANLVGGRWVTKGKWASGADYHQEISHEWGLSGKIMTVKTYDYVDSKQFDDAMRNYGVRGWDDQKKQIVFCDFNVFGGVVNGTVAFNGKDILYSYDYSYKGKTETFTDAWIYKDDDTYDYKVGIFKNGTWEKVFLSSVYNRVR